LLFLLTGGLARTLGDSPSAAEQEIRRAKALAGDIPAQANALTRLIWGEENQDPEVAALARETLINYSKYAYPALHGATLWVDKVHTADLAATLIETRRRFPAMPAGRYVPALNQLLWFGSVDARRLVIPELAINRHRQSILPAIDAAYENPELTLLVLRELPRFMQDETRHYLGQVLHDGNDTERALAAEALASIGGRCLATLREAVLAERPEVRLVALEVLLPSTAPSDLSVLYEYLANFPEDDAQLLESVRERAVMLEALLENRRARESASPTDEY
jgi:hypothetical protein